MHHTIDRLIGNPEDYKICLNCGSWNWYENKECVNCQSAEFRKATLKDAGRLLEAFKDVDILNTEMDV